MNKNKALLDSLMGPSRNKSASERSGQDFLERNVCKYYLIGCCPHAILGGKVERWEKCTKIHSQAMIEEFTNHAAHDKYQKEYEASVVRLLSDFASEADARASREQEKKRAPEIIVRIPDHLKRKIDSYQETKQNLLR